VLDAFLEAGRKEYSADPEFLAKQRASSGVCFPKLSDFQNLLRSPSGPTSAIGTVISAGPTGAGGSSSGNFSTKSNYFRLASLVTIGTSEFNLYSLLYRDDNAGFVHPILRTFSAD